MCISSEVVKRKFKEAEKTEINCAISYTLAGARDWEGGRKIREIGKNFYIIYK